MWADFSLVDPIIIHPHIVQGPGPVVESMGLGSRQPGFKSQLLIAAHVPVPQFSYL